MPMTTQAEVYFTDGCGRCSLGGTPDCKVHSWRQELLALRNIALDCGLEEACKWGFPCYTFQGKNILMISAFKDNCVISFFKGSLLRDDHGILSLAGDNSYVARIVRFTNLNEIFNLEAVLKTYLYEAIEIENAGLKAPKGEAPDMPDELLRKFDEIPSLQSAFEALTPGRQRGYLLHFTSAKQSATRTARIEKCMPKIMAGKGMQE